tara:strand:- start:149 stop:919 length:771 start_codon:yes stop_codon:yes gene_type:complete
VSGKRKFTSVQVSKNNNTTSILLDSNVFSTLDYKSICLEFEEICSEVNQDDETNVVFLSIENTNELYSLKGVNFDNIDSIEDYRLASKIDKIQCPVIVSMKGYILDNLLEIALSGDIRICTNDSVFGLQQITNGFLPWDGATQRLPRIIGKSKSVEMILSGEVITSEQAIKLGLINYMVSQSEIETTATELITKLESLAPIALRYVKEAVKEGFDMNIRQGFLFESDLSILLHSTHDRKIGLDSFKTKEPPNFIGE